MCEHVIALSISVSTFHAQAVISGMHGLSSMSISYPRVIPVESGFHLSLSFVSCSGVYVAPFIATRTIKPLKPISVLQIKTKTKPLLQPPEELDPLLNPVYNITLLASKNTEIFDQVLENMGSQDHKQINYFALLWGRIGNTNDPKFRQ